MVYTGVVPKLWNDTIDAHRRAVHDATLDAAAALVGKHGLLAVTMSRIAQETGIGRATIYKYFANVEAILVAWHERQVSTHLEQLIAVGSKSGGAMERLEAVLAEYALITHRRHHGSEIAALLHRGEHVAKAHRKLREFIRDLIAQGVARGEIRSDIAPEELANYCLYALNAASGASSKEAVRRLVTLTLSGLHPAP